MSFDGDLYPTSGATSVLTTKGDMVDFDTQRQRLGIGSTSDVLTVAGGLPTWSAPAGGGKYELIASEQLTSGDASSIEANFSTYAQTTFSHMVAVLNSKASGGSASIDLQIGGNTGSDYYGIGWDDYNTSQTSTSYNSTAMRIKESSRGDTFFVIIDFLVNAVDGKTMMFSKSVSNDKNLFLGSCYYNAVATSINKVKVLTTTQDLKDLTRLDVYRVTI